MPDLNEFISTEESAEKLKYHVEHVRPGCKKAASQV